MAECLVSGIVEDLTGKIVVNANLQFTRASDIFAFNGTVRQPTPITARTNRAGFVSVRLVPGEYSVSIQTGGAPKTFGIIVPEAATADLVTITTPTPEQASTITELVENATTAATDAASSASAAASAAAQASVFNNGPSFPTVAALLSDTTLTYVGSTPLSVLPGDYVRTRAEGFAYQVASSIASDHDVTTAGGVKLYVVADASGFASVSAFGAVGVGDETAIIQKAFAKFLNVSFPAGTFTVTAPISLRDKSRIIGAGRDRTIITRSGGVLLSAVSSGAGSFLSCIEIRDLQLLGSVSVDGFSEFFHLISVNGVSDMVVDNCTIKGFRGDGIYLGATGGRHNVRVRITNNLIDGVNKDNRNGLSVIDCDDLKVSGNTFIRCSRSNMPGPIDIEPNENDNTVKNISIVGNHFEDTNCGEAAISVVIVNPTLTVDPKNFNISGNSFAINKRMVSFRVTGSYTEKHNLRVVGNVGEVLNIGTYYPKWKGGVFANNVLSVTDFGVVGIAAGDEIDGVSFTGNSIDGGGVANRAFSVRDGDGVTVSGNVFSNFTTYGILFGISGGSLSNVTVTGNTFVNCGTYSVGSAGGIIGSTCTYANNTSAIKHQFPAWQTDDTGDITNGDTGPTTFNADNLPSAFARAGIFRAAINGDTAVPSTGGFQGILETHCEAGSNGRKWKYQVYWPANNTVKVSSFYLRKAANASDTWEAWAEVVGV